MRILALLPPGTNSRCQFAEFLRGLQLAGHEVLYEDTCLFVAQHQTLRAGAAPDAQAKLLRFRTGYAKHLAVTFAVRRCDVVICLWADPLFQLLWGRKLDGSEDSCLEACGIPVMYWWLDAPFWAYQGQAPALLDARRLVGPLHTHLVNNPGTAAEMRRVLKLKNVVSLPYGVDEVTFRVEPARTPEFDLAVCAGIGDEPPTDLMRACLEADRADADAVDAIRRDQARLARPSLIAALESARIPAALLAPLADAWLAEQLADADRPMLEKFAAAAGTLALEDALTVTHLLLDAPGCASHWAWVTHQIRRLDAWQRTFTAAYLSHRFRALFVGQGAEAWAAHGWEIRGELTGFVAYHELAACYSRCMAGLNVMRYQDDVGLNPKVLEIAASGVVPLQRWRAGIDEQFRDREEILTFRTPSQAAARLQRVIDDPAARVRIARAARERVQASHTWRCRASTIFDRAADGSSSANAPAPAAPPVRAAAA